MASIIQIGSRWRAQVRRLGSKSISKTFRTKGAAEAWARDIESSIDKGREAAVEENDEWVPLIGDSLEVLLRQPRYPVPPEYEAKRKADPAIEPHPNEFIFRFDKSTASKYFKRACVDKGIDDLRLHDLRHEATSALFEDGWDIPEVAAVTGHKDWRNLKRYTNLRPDQVAKKGQLTVMNRD
nr:tyrosine-type recombinase/integrase [Burkholderia pseudomallei]